MRKHMFNRGGSESGLKVKQSGLHVVLTLKH